MSAYLSPFALMLLGGVLFAGTALVGAAQAEDAAATPDHEAPVASVAAPPAISVAAITSAELVDRVWASGRIAAVEEVAVAPQIEGQRIETLLVDLGDWVEAEWARSAERYEELPFGESTEQSLFLLAHALEPGKAHDASVEKTAIAYYAEATRRGVIVAPDEIVSHAARTLYPLHPAAASALVQATRKLGQNERSLFGFLQSLEPAGLQRYAHETEYEAANWYRTGAAFDYVLAMAGNRPAGERGRRFALASDALVVSADMSSEHRDVLKTIALFSVLEPVPGLKADAETIAWCLDLQPKAVAVFIDDLIGRNIVFRRPHREL